MIKLNLKHVLTNIKGDKPIMDGDEPLTLGEAMGNILIMDKKAGKMKAFILAQKLATSKSIEVDNADFSMIKDAVEATEIYSNLVAGQIADLLNGLKDK